GYLRDILEVRAPADECAEVGGRLPGHSRKASAGLALPLRRDLDSARCPASEGACRSTVPHLPMVEGIPGLLADLDGDTGNGNLTLARIWMSLATGTIQTKDAAADWAAARLPVADERAPARRG